MQNKTRNAGGRLKISQRGKKENKMMDLCHIIPSFVWHGCAAAKKQTQKNQHGCVINQSKFATNEMKNETQ